jgi:hypothetical protein
VAAPNWSEAQDPRMHSTGKAVDEEDVTETVERFDTQVLCTADERVVQLRYSADNGELC